MVDVVFELPNDVPGNHIGLFLVDRIVYFFG